MDLDGKSYFPGKKVSINMQQLGLPISLNSKMLLSNFLETGNQPILSFINNLFSEDGSSIVFIAGEESSGKTHLLQGCVFKALDLDLKAIYLDINQPLPIDFINTLSIYDWVCIDNIDALDEFQQQELFDLYNQIKQTKTKLIVSAPSLPGGLILLKDLKTRLSLALVYQLEQLSDQEKISLLQQKMQDKNINIDHKIYEYLFKYFSRDLNTVLGAIDRLDQESLQQKSSISIPFVKKILKI